MRECIVPTLVLLFLQAAPPSNLPAGWKTVDDAKGLCRIMAPPDWTPFSDTSGAVIFKDATTAIAVVTSQPGQEFKPMPEAIQRMLHIAKDKMFENSAKRTFYQDRVSRNSDDSNAYSISVPAKNGTCSCHVTFLPSVSQETVRKIALSLEAARE
jgi:hypothetical protein